MYKPEISLASKKVTPNMFANFSILPMTTDTFEEVLTDAEAVPVIDVSTLGESSDPATDLLCHRTATNLNQLLAQANGSWNPTLVAQIAPTRDAVRDACVDAFMRGGQNRDEALASYADLSKIGNFDVGSMMAKATLACKAPKSR